MVASDCDARAQTNLQLYRQLAAAGYTAGDVERFRAAYAVATRLFASQMRPEGRPFVCHLVGVASLLVMAGASKTTSIAGLLHSVYSHADFGHGRGHVTRGAPGVLRDLLGADVERLLDCYARFPWRRATVDEWLAQPAALDPDTREVVKIRLADVLEDALDDGLRESAKAANPNRDVPLPRIVQLADAVGCAQLGICLREALDDPLRGGRVHPIGEQHVGSYFACPPSWREKMLPRFVRWARRKRAAL